MSERLHYSGHNSKEQLMSSPPKIICCGLSCLDMQLHNTEPPRTLETVTPFSHCSFAAGGSAPQTVLALSSLSVNSSIVIHIGKDAHGQKMREFLSAKEIDTSTIVESQNQTSLAVLPLLTDGRRACFVSLECNLQATPHSLLPKSIQDRCLTSQLRIFHFGYPHLMPKLQGYALRELFVIVQNQVPSIMFTLDVNGADKKETPECPVLLPALEMVTAIHANLEEACVITGLEPSENASELTAEEIRPIVDWFTANGANIALITSGKDGVFASTSKSPNNPAPSFPIHPGSFVHREAYAVTEGAEINASGAGDAFMAGIIAALSDEDVVQSLNSLMDCGLASALHRIDTSFCGKQTSLKVLMDAMNGRRRIESRVPS